MWCKSLDNYLNESSNLEISRKCFGKTTDVYRTAMQRVVYSTPSRTPNLVMLHQQVAASVGVRQFVVPGSTVEDSHAALDLANRKPNVRCEKYGVQAASKLSIHLKCAVGGASQMYSSSLSPSYEQQSAFWVKMSVAIVDTQTAYPPLGTCYIYLFAYVRLQIVFPTAGVHPYHVEACGALDEAMAAIAALAAFQDGEG